MKIKLKAPEAETHPDHPLLTLILQEVRALKESISRDPAANDACAAPERRPIARTREAKKITKDGNSKFFARQNPKDPSWDPTFPRKFKLGDSPFGPNYYYVDELQAWVDARAKRRLH